VRIDRRHSRDRGTTARHGRRESERGAATAELVIAAPLLLLLIVLVIQFALYLHAAHVAQAVATQAMTAARLQGGSVASGQAEAASVLTQLGHGLLVHPQVAVTRNATVAQANVTAQVEAVIPFWHLGVHATVAGPVEAFRTASQTP
jgi:Flp pilus assembly protein TadG